MSSHCYAVFLSILFLTKVTDCQMNCAAPSPTPLNTPTGSITQPPFPSPVWNGANCGDFFWVIQAPGPCDTITLTLDSYSLAPGLDRVEVFDGTYPGGGNLGRFDGILQPTDPVKPVITSTGNVMTLWFNTTNYPGSSINFFAHYQINSIPCPSNPTVPANPLILIKTLYKLTLFKIMYFKTWPVFLLAAGFVSTIWCLTCVSALLFSSFLLAEHHQIPNRDVKLGFNFKEVGGHWRM